MAVENHLQKQLRGYRRTTGGDSLSSPDHPAVLQSYISQELDIAPRYPVLNRVLEFWTPKSTASSTRSGSRRSAWSSHRPGRMRRI